VKVTHKVTTAATAYNSFLSVEVLGKLIRLDPDKPSLVFGIVDTLVWSAVLLPILMPGEYSAILCFRVKVFSGNR